ncbi:MAG: putative quinol monooxygenase [Desulfatirhabdiaceae bacterium]
MIHATIRMVIPPSKRTEALQILTAIVRRNRMMPGCLGCRMYQEVEDRNAIMIDEIWEHMEDLESNLRSKDYLSVLLVVEMAMEKPDIRFDTISESTGVDTIEKARSTLNRLV